MPNIDETSLQNIGNSLEEPVDNQEVESQAEPEKVKLGEQEYTTEELSELVGLGSRAREIGEAHGGFDKFVTEYGRKSERIGELKKELESLSSQKVVEPEETSIEQAREAARKLGIVLKDDLDGYYQNRRGAEKLLENCQTLETKLDGSDGRPKFETERVLEFMNQNTGFTDPMRAYEAMHLDEVSSWKAEQINKSRTTGISTVTETVTNKMPESVRATKDNLYDLIKEQINN